MRPLRLPPLAVASGSGVALVVLAGAGCLAPTEATLAISSDTCQTDAATLTTNITVVSRQTLAASDGALLAPTTSTQNCSADGGVGTLVVVPGPNGNGPIVVTVAMGVGINPNYCGVTDAGTRCIIETRELTLVDNEPFTLPIEMLKVCEGVYCPPGQTCIGPHQCGSDQVSMTDCPAPHQGCLVSIDAGGGGPPDTGARPADGGTKGTDGSNDATVHDAGHDSAADATMLPKDAEAEAAKYFDAAKESGLPFLCKGESIDAGCLEQLQGNQAYPWAIAAYGGRVYWTSGCQDQGFTCTPDGAVWSADNSRVDAGENIAAHQNGPTAISASDSGVYWTTRGTCVNETGHTYNCTGTVMRQALDGGAVATIAGSTAGGAGQESEPLGVVAVGSAVYWVNNGIQYNDGNDYADASGSVNRAGTTGIPMPEAIVHGQQGAGGIAVDPTNVFWTDFGPAGTGGVKGSLVKSGLDGAAPFTLASDQDYIVNVAVADASVYWLTQGYGTEAGASGHNGSLQVTSVGGAGVPMTLASQLGYEWNLAVDDRAVYWADPVGGSILRTSRTKGGSVVTLVSHLATPTNVFLDNGVLYWVNNGTCTDAGKCSGSIMKLTLR